MILHLIPEIQKAYRERKKASEGMSYLDKERRRVQKYYVPIDQRNAASKQTRREKVREYVREHRARRKLQQQVAVQSVNEELCNSETTTPDENGVSSSTYNSCLRVKLPAFERARSRKRISRATTKHHREIKKLRLENETLKRRVKMISKRNERLKKQ